MQIPKFAIISEGYTDQIIIKNILVGYFNNPDLIVRPLRPAENSKIGNWHQVLKYCQSSDFEEFLESTPDINIIIQIDADIFIKNRVLDEYKVIIDDVQNHEAINQVIQEKIKHCIGEDLLSQYAERLIFAIAIQEIECWLLPIYFDKEQKSATENCKSIIEQVMRDRRVRVSRNKESYIRKASEPYQNNETILAKYQENPSLKIFIENLKTRNLDFSETEEEWV